MQHIVSRFVFFLSLCCVGMLCIPMALASPPTVAVVANSSHFEILHRIEAALFTHPSPRPKLIRIESSNFQNYLRSDRAAQFRLIVAVGAPATKLVLEQRQSTPVLSILLRQQVLEEILESTGNIFHDTEHPITAIYLDQPIDRKIDLIRSLYPNPDFHGPIGVLLGPHSVSLQEQLIKEGEAHDLKLNLALVDTEENPVPIMNQFLENSKILLSLPDNTIYNPKTARGILLSAYRTHVPVIGFSKAFVQNGALASVYSNEKQIANQVAKEIINITNHPGKPLPLPKYPHEFSVAINFQVARSLGLNVPEDKVLQSELDAKERQKPQGGVCSLVTMHNKI